MKIKYLKDAPQGDEGDVVEIDSVYGIALVAMEYAEEVLEEQPKAKTTTKKTTAK